MLLQTIFPAAGRARWQPCFDPAWHHRGRGITRQNDNCQSGSISPGAPSLWEPRRRSGVRLFEVIPRRRWRIDEDSARSPDPLAWHLCHCNGHLRPSDEHARLRFRRPAKGLVAIDCILSGSVFSCRTASLSDRSIPITTCVREM